MNKLAIIASESITHTKVTRECDYLYTGVSYSINFKDESFKNSNLTQEQLFKLISEKNEIPSTSQPSYQNLYDVFKNKLEQYEKIIIVVPSRELSGTFQGCLNVVNDLSNEGYKENIYLIEAPSISLSEVYICEQIISKYENNIPLDTIIDSLDSNNTKTYAFPSDVNFLKLSGRVTGSQAIAINLLKIKPVVLMQAFKRPEIVKKLRGFKAILKFIDKDLLNNEDLSKIEKVLISNIGIASEQYEAIQNIFVQKKVNYEVTDIAPPVVATHFGPESFGLFIKHKN